MPKFADFAETKSAGKGKKKHIISNQLKDIKILNQLNTKYI